MKGQGGLVVAGDEADVAPILLGGLELEVPVAQAQQHGGGADGIVDGRARLGGVDDDLLTDGPIGVPPGMGGAGEGEDGQRAEQKAVREGVDCVMHGGGFGVLKKRAQKSVQRRNVRKGLWALVLAWLKRGMARSSEPLKWLKRVIRVPAP